VNAKPTPLAIRRAVWARSSGWCECGCGQRAVHLHHRKLRSQGGRHEAVNLLHLAAGCHRAIHENPELSYALGYLVHSWAEPHNMLAWSARPGGVA